MRQLECSGTASPYRRALGWLRRRWPQSQVSLFAAFVLLVAAIDLLVLRNLSLTGPFQRSDISPPFVGWNQLNFATASAWNFQLFGAPSGYPYALIVPGIVATVTNAPGIVELIGYAASLPASSIAAYLFLRYWRVPEKRAWIFALLYQLSPWLIGEFVTGEPVFTWAYALLPLILLGLLYTTNHPHELIGYLGLATVLAIAAGFTLQVVLLVPLLTVPFMVRSRALLTWRDSAILWTGWIVAGAAAVLANTFSIESYVTGSQSLTLRAGSLPFTAVLVGPPLEDYYLTLLVIVIGVAVLLIRHPVSRKQEDSTLCLSFALILFLLDLLYFSTPGPISDWLFLHSILLYPFIDTDKFVLFGWVTLYLLGVVALRDSTLQFKRSPQQTPARDTNLYSSRNFRHDPTPNGLGAASISIGLAILVGTSALATIQPTAGGENGVQYLAVGPNFSSSQISPGYSELRSYIEGQGGSFGLSFHTLLVPQNPGSYSPWAVGEYMIPGFLPPGNVQKTAVTGIIDNDSRYLETMALSGIRLIAVIPDPPNLWWPTLANSSPSLTTISPNNWIPLGSSASYLRILDNWSSLEVVYKSSDLTVFLNPMYESPALTYSATNSIFALSNGTFLGTTNTSPTGRNLIATTNFSGGPGEWGMNESTRDDLLSNGTFKLLPGSPGISLGLDVTLLRNTTYLWSITLKSNNPNIGYPLKGGPTYGAVYWDTRDASFSNITGAVFTPLLDGVWNGTVQLLFTTVPGHTTLPAAVYLYAEPPQGNQTVYVKFSDLHLYSINGSSTFQQLVRGAEVEPSGLTSFTLAQAGGFVAGEWLTLDTLFGPNWFAKTTNGTPLSVQAGPAGLLTILVSRSTTFVDVWYALQSPYTIEVVVSSAILLGLGIGFAFLATRFIHRRTRSGAHILQIGRNRNEI